jgi:hypothetical protein
MVEDVLTKKLQGRIKISTCLSRILFTGYRRVGIVGGESNRRDLSSYRRS